MEVVRVKLDLGISFPGGLIVFLGTLNGSRRFCIQRRVFVSREIRPERLEDGVSSNRFLQPVNDRPEANEAHPHRTNNCDHRLTGFCQLCEYSESFRVLEQGSSMQWVRI